MHTWPFEFLGHNAGTGGGGGGGGATYINSMQPFAITIAASSTSNTATISSVTTGNAVIFFGGFTTSDTNTAFQEFMTRAELTNSTTVTAFRSNSNASTVTVYGTVVEFKAAALGTAGVQAGTITVGNGSASGTATISTVSTGASAVFYLGLTNTTTGFATSSVATTLTLTNSTTVIATRGTTSTAVLTVGYAVVNFASGIINSLQQRSVTLTSANSSDTDTISSVATANTMLVYGGNTAGTTAFNSAMYNLQLAGSTSVTMARSSTSSASRTVNYTVVEFVSGVLNSMQRGTLAMTNAISNDATISSVNTSVAVCNWLGFSSSLSSNNPAEAYSAAKLSSATDVHSVVNSSASGVTATIAYEVPEFK